VSDVLRRHVGRAGTGVLLVSLLAAPAGAQQVRVGDSLRVTLSGRIHVQFATTSVDSAQGAPQPASEFVIRRAPLTFDVVVNDLVSARMEPDYSTNLGAGRLTLRDAYVRLTFAPGLRATLGQFKRPLDLFQLASTTQFLVAERGGRIRGVDACGPLVAVCSYSNLAVGLLYADRDLGLMLDGEAVPHRVRYAASVTNGEPFFAQETSSGKQFTGRLSVTPIPGVTVSANGAHKDYTHPTTAAADRAIAWGGDVEFGDYDAGFHLQAGLIGGDNWRVARSAPQDTTGVVSLLAGQVITSYRQPVHGRWVVGLEPVARASWADPNRSAARDDAWLFTPGVILHLRGRSMVYVNVDLWLPKAGDSEYALASQVSVNF
jgi:hypothetical protein